MLCAPSCGADREPQVRIELTTARLRIECSTPELLWRGTTTCPGADSNRDALRHHPLKMACLPVSPPGRLRIATGPTGLEPATSRVTVECSNQAELRPLTQSGLAWRALPPPNPISCPAPRVTADPASVRPHSPYGSRTRLCTVKGCRPKPIDERAAPTCRIAVTGFEPVFQP